MAAIGLCAAAPVAAQDARLSVHGSNTIGAELMPALIQGFAQTAGYGVERTPGPSAESEAMRLTFGARTMAEIQLERFGSSTSFHGLIAGAAELGMSSRRVRDAEVEALERRFDIEVLSPDSEHVVALDGIAVIVSPANPMSALLLEDVARIFSGEIRNWEALGLPAGPITVHARDGESGTFDAFEALVLEPAGAELRADASRYASNARLAAAVARDPLAIGFVPLSVAKEARALSIALSCGMVIEPEPFSVKAEEYPLTRRLYLYSAGTPRTPLARDLLTFAKSDVAQPIIAQVGFVDQAPQLQAQTMYADRVISALAEAGGGASEKAAVAEFAQLTANLTRLSPTFRFRKGGALLDAKALNDSERLARWLQQPENAGKSAYLIGFADSIGGFRSNLGLSVARAEAVRRAVLVQVRPGFDGSRIRTLGLSTVAPIACNDNDVGRASNRRVEVWVSR